MIAPCPHGRYAFLKCTGGGTSIIIVTNIVEGFPSLLCAAAATATTTTDSTHSLYIFFKRLLGSTVATSYLYRSSFNLFTPSRTVFTLVAGIHCKPYIYSYSLHLAAALSVTGLNPSSIHTSQRIMGRITASAAFALLAFSILVKADSSIPTCGQGNKCPDNLPCCSRK